MPVVPIMASVPPHESQKGSKATPHWWLQASSAAG
jgi:hypothetical protein